MNAQGSYFAAIGRTIISLADGLAVTFSYLFRKPITLQYPDRTAQPLLSSLPTRSRGILEIDPDLCTACQLCAKTCPIDCINIQVEKAEAGRLVTVMDVDIGKCMFCGLCVEVCPADAIRHSHEFEGGTNHPDKLVLHFLSQPKPPAKPRKKDEPPLVQKPLGSLVRQVMPGAWDPPGHKRRG